jgi:protein phosphatase
MGHPEPITTPLRYVAAGDTHIGLRDHNEDTILLRPDLRLYLLADGAGGENAGNVASALATTAVAHYFEETEAAAAERPIFDDLGLPTAARRLSAAIQRANREIIGIAKSSHRHHGMGSTIVAAHFGINGVLHVGHVGDSRCYRLRDSRLELLTNDHSLVNDVLELRPDISDDRLARLPRNVITRALGMNEKLRVAVGSFQVMSGDRYLLASDGLTNELDDEQLRACFRLAKTPEDQVRLLIEMSTESGAGDNVAAVVIGAELAPGAKPVGDVDRSVVRPERKVPTPRTPSEPPGDYPEIIIVDEEWLEDDGSQKIHVVPSSAKDPTIVHALHGFVEKREASRCAKCGAAMNVTVLVCPACGMPRRPTDPPMA